MYKFFVIFLFVCCTNVSAQDMSPKLQEIIYQTMAVDGSLTEEMYQEFWAELKRGGTPKEIHLLKKMFHINIIGAQEYQKELWSSAKISYENSKVVKTQRLIQLETEAPVTFEKSILFPKGSPNYRQAILTYKQQMKISMENSARLLNAAATRSSMTAVEGQVIPLNMSMINDVLMKLEASFSRLQNLFNENWHEFQNN